jgi:hypothetical protein
VKDGRLWSQFGKDEDEYLLLGAETFFIKSDLGSVTFSRDAQGHVTGYTDHRVEDRKSTSKRLIEQAGAMRSLAYHLHYTHLALRWALECNGFTS